MKELKPQANNITAIIVIMSLALWIAALFIAYIADDWTSPSADERSIPPARLY